MIVKVNNRPVANPFNGLFNSLFGEFEVAQNQVASKSANGFVPVNIVETENAYHLEIAAPGRKKENFKVKVEGQLLTISYENTPVAEGTENENEDQKQIRTEFNTSNFKRSFNVDDKINADNILAKYEDGLLKVLLPKKEETKPVAKDITIA